MKLRPHLIQIACFTLALLLLGVSQLPVQNAYAQFHATPQHEITLRVSPFDLTSEEIQIESLIENSFREDTKNHLPPAEQTSFSTDQLPPLPIVLNPLACITALTPAPAIALGAQNHTLRATPPPN